MLASENRSEGRCFAAAKQNRAGFQGQDARRRALPERIPVLATISLAGENGNPRELVISLNYPKQMISKDAPLGEGAVTDETLLRETGITDFAHYAVGPTQPLVQTLFLPLKEGMIPISRELLCSK